MVELTTGGRLSGIFAAEDPYALARAWLAEAEASEPEDANAVALATVDRNGLPNVRMVLVKEIEPDQARGGFVFFTNFDSAKGQELKANARAAMVFHCAESGTKDLAEVESLVNDWMPLPSREEVQ